MMEQTILEMVMVRLNRSGSNESMEAYLNERIRAAIEELKECGIHIRNTARDIILVTDLVCWQYANREKNDPMPQWLQAARRERFLQETT